MRSKSDADPVSRFAIFRETHHSRCADALNAGLPWLTILRSEIDSPFEGNVGFNAMLRLSVERRRTRIAGDLARRRREKERT